MVRAKALTGPLTRTFQALVAGTVSPGQADTIHTALTALPSGGLVRRRGEKLMLTHATRLTGTELARAGRHLVEVVDPDAVDRRLQAALERQERAAHLDRYLAITEDRAGGVWIKGHGTAEDGALLTAALLPLTRPEPATTDSETDQETGDMRARRRATRASTAPGIWDALITLARHGLDTNLVPDTHGTPPRLLVTLDHHTLTRDLANAGITAGVGTTADGTDLPPGVLRRLACDAEIIPAVLGTRSEVLDVGRTRRTGHPRPLDRPRDPRPALHLPRLPPTTGDVPGPPPHPLARRRPHRPRQPRPAVRTPPPHPPPHPLADPAQPPRPKTRIPTTTQTRPDIGMDPISTTARLVEVRSDSEGEPSCLGRGEPLPDLVRDQVAGDQHPAPLG